MHDLTGTGALIRFMVRRDRVRILVWIASIGLLVLASAASVKGLFPTQADLDDAAAATHGNAAAIAFNGPDQALDTMGGQVAFQVGSFGLSVMALMSIFIVGRATRGEEESGRLDLVRSMAVGRHASTAAVLVVAVTMSVVLGVIVALGLLTQGLATTGSVVLGLSFCALGLVFIGITLVAAQVSENTRVVYGASVAVLGMAFVLRAAGDVGDGTLSWLSPIGWSQKTRPYAGERWWPLLVSLAVAAGLAVVAAVLATRRDVGGGLVAPRPGPPAAPAGLGSPLGLAFRLQRGMLAAWTAGLVITGVSYGSIATDVEDFISENPDLQEMVARAGGDLTDSYLATTLMMLALMGSGFSISAVLRLRSEETALHAEPLLATPLSRGRWIAGHLFMALAGSAVVAGTAMFGLSLTFGLMDGDLGQVPRLLVAGLAYVPAMWLLAALTLVAFGLAPRVAAPVAWSGLAACFVVGLLGDVFGFPAWVVDLSPFERIPQVPARPFDVVPVAAVVLVTVALAAVGFTGFRHRDVG